MRDLLRDVVGFGTKNLEDFIIIICNVLNQSISFFVVNFWLLRDEQTIVFDPIQRLSNDGWSSYSPNDFLNRLVICVREMINFGIYLLTSNDILIILS